LDEDSQGRTMGVAELERRVGEMEARLLNVEDATRDDHAKLDDLRGLLRWLAATLARILSDGGEVGADEPAPDAGADAAVVGDGVFGSDRLGHVPGVAE